MIKIFDWVIDADSRCYIVGKLKQRTTKEGKTEEYVADPKYYSTLTMAFDSIREAERRNIVKEGNLIIEEAVRLIRESEKRLSEVFEAVLKDGGSYNASCDH